MPPEFVPNSGQLLDVALRSITFEENPTFEVDGAEEVVYSLRVAHEVEIVGTSASEIDVELSLDWTVAGTNQPPASAPFELALTACGRFEWIEERPEIQRRTWTEYNGIYLVWPYLRAFVSTVTALSRLPTFTLQTLAVPRPELVDDEPGGIEPAPADPA